MVQDRGHQHGDGGHQVAPEDLMSSPPPPRACLKNSSEVVGLNLGSFRASYGISPRCTLGASIVTERTSVASFKYLETMF